MPEIRFLIDGNLRDIVDTLINEIGPQVTHEFRQLTASQNTMSGVLEVNAGDISGETRYIPPRDMKPVLLSSRTAKISKDGNRYVRIPIKDKSTNETEVKTVSDKSSPSSWIYPGHVSHVNKNQLDDVAVAMAIRQALRGVLR